MGDMGALHHQLRSAFISHRAPITEAPDHHETEAWRRLLPRVATHPSVSARARASMCQVRFFSCPNSSKMSICAHHRSSRKNDRGTSKFIITARKQSCGKVMLGVSQQALGQGGGVVKGGSGKGRYTPPPRVQPVMTTKAGGTHPTGMHSCCLGTDGKIIKGSIYTEQKRQISSTIAAN